LHPGSRNQVARGWWIVWRRRGWRGVRLLRATPGLLRSISRLGDEERLPRSARLASMSSQAGSLGCPRMSGRRCLRCSIASSSRRMSLHLIRAYSGSAVVGSVIRTHVERRSDVRRPAAFDGFACAVHAFAMPSVVGEPNVCTVFLSGVEFFGAVVVQLEGHDWAAPSPCKGWSALDVVGHADAVLTFCAEVICDRSPRWDPLASPGSAMRGDPLTWWQAAVAAFAPCVELLDPHATDRRASSPNLGTLQAALSFPAVDFFVHGWDLAASARRTLVIPPEVIRFAHTTLDPMPEAVVRGPQAFGPAVQPAADASPTEVFLSWTGRRPERWRQ
jgi:uncharacterized protein (TIGR03086 family)